MVGNGRIRRILLEISFVESRTQRFFGTLVKIVSAKRKPFLLFLLNPTPLRALCFSEGRRMRKEWTGLTRY